MSATTELQAPDRYVFDNAWEHARRRLTLLEQCTDASTIRRLRSLGIQPGWRCLEAGAGAGSIARWLCSQVGPTGRVLAADLDTRFLDQLDEPNLDVQRMDLRSDELPRGSFDLIHARALLMHIPQREQILDSLIAALRPGGVLLLEEADHFPITTLDTGLYAEVFEAFLDSAVRAGMAKDWARHLPTELRRRRLHDIWADCETPLFEGGAPYSEFWRLSLSQARDLVMAEGISPQQIGQWDSQLGKPGRWFPSMAIVAACGRRAS
ncbi:MAG: class I SAM-dependent methyltransferase [Pseudonocardiaceae bacterium]